MLDTKSLNDEHDCNVVSMTSLNIHDANDMQSHKLGDAMFDEYGIFSPFDENIYYDTLCRMNLTDKDLKPSSTVFHVMVPGKSAYLMSTTQPSYCRRCWASKCRGL